MLNIARLLYNTVYMKSKEEEKALQDAEDKRLLQREWDITHIYKHLAKKDMTFWCVFIWAINPEDPQINSYIYMDWLDWWTFRDEKTLIFKWEGAKDTDLIRITDVIWHDVTIGRVLAFFSRIDWYEDEYIPLEFKWKTLAEFLYTIWDDCDEPIECQSDTCIDYIKELLQATID